MLGAILATLMPAAQAGMLTTHDDTVRHDFMVPYGAIHLTGVYVSGGGPDRQDPGHYTVNGGWLFVDGHDILREVVWCDVWPRWEEVWCRTTPTIFANGYE